VSDALPRLEAFGATIKSLLSTHKNILLAGDINLDYTRCAYPSYRHASMVGHQDGRTSTEGWSSHYRIWKYFLPDEEWPGDQVLLGLAASSLKLGVKPEKNRRNSHKQPQSDTFFCSLLLH
jgi:hypothetical protein